MKNWRKKLTTMLALSLLLFSLFRPLFSFFPNWNPNPEGGISTCGDDPTRPIGSDIILGE